MATKKSSPIAIEKSSGNIFADIGVPRPEEALAKAMLALRISQIVTANQWTQSQAAEALGVDQAKVSAILNGRLRGFSTDRLFRFLNLLGQDVKIEIRPQVRNRTPSIQVQCQP